MPNVINFMSVKWIVLSHFFFKKFVMKFRKWIITLNLGIPTTNRHINRPPFAIGLSHVCFNCSRKILTCVFRFGVIVYNGNKNE